MSTDHHAGLEDVLAVKSAITLIEGKELQYRGIATDVLAEKSFFEEVVYLLWYGRLPGKTELERLEKEIHENNLLPMEVREHINHLPRQVHPMGALRTLFSSLAMYDHEADDNSHDTEHRKAVRILSKIPMLITSFERHRKAKSSVEPRSDLGFAANVLYMLHGEIPDEVSVKALDTALILYAEHELNASTFAARIATATEADMYSSITAALSTLKGKLHGGANQKAMEMLLDIADVEMVPEYVDDLLAKGQRVMGFGHRVYKEGDPRVPILKKQAKELVEANGFTKYFEIAEAVESYMAEKKSGLLPNIDFYSGLTFYALGFPTDMFTSIFAVARTAGWIAHIFEQRSNNRLIRPRAEYTGPRNVAYVEIEKR